MNTFKNPFRPGAGQTPPLLAGRQKEQNDFKKLLEQKPILKNLVLTGLRGVGKTVLLETFRPIALEKGWLWTGTDFSESATISEYTLVVRILADLSKLVSPFTLYEEAKSTIGFIPTVQTQEIKLTYDVLMQIHKQTPGLEADKLKRILEIVWETVKKDVQGIVLAYDEAQILKDQAGDKQYPLSLLLEVIQYLQRKNIPYLLVLTGLPTLFPNLVEARTYAERMFQIFTIDKLSDNESRTAIVEPIKNQETSVRFTDFAIQEIIKYSGGYPYFIQFFCKELFDTYLQQKAVGIQEPQVSISEITHKLDTDFYSGRWDKIPDRLRNLLKIIAKLPRANDEFTIQDIIQKSNEIGEKWKSSNISQSLSRLTDQGLIYNKRHGKYSFAVPMLANYINRQE